MPHSGRFHATGSTNSKGPKVINSWQLLDFVASGTSRDELVELIAEQILVSRVRARHVQAWHNKKLSGTPNPFRDHIAEQLEDMTGTATHLEGLVSEHLWHFVAEQTIHIEALFYKSPPPKGVTDHGGDGFLIHQKLHDRSYYLRLWEIKKRSRIREDGTLNTDRYLSPSRSIEKACKQLDKDGRRYIAQMMALADQYTSIPELYDLLEYLPEWWDAGDPRVSLGIAVSITDPSPRVQPFGEFGGKYATKFSGNDLRGLLITVGCLTQFSRDVKEAVWNGL